MDDFLKKSASGAKTEPAFEDKKIEFKIIKEKKSSKTYIFNLNKYIKDPAQLDTVLKTLKKSLGTSCTARDTEFGYGYGFGGDFSQKIKRYLIDNGYVNKEDFK
jgi:translation initiation factor 1 (eIF-1/SUI1)